MNNKKKIIAICVCVALLAGTILSGTIAYFTDDEAITNTFTSGNIEIDLKETVVIDGVTTTVEVNGATNPFDASKDFKLFPGDEFTKEPVITVEQGSEKAFVAAKIIISDGSKDFSNITNPELIKADGTIDYAKIISGGVLDSVAVATSAADAEAKLADAETTAAYVMFQENDGAGTYTLYVYAREAVDASTEAKTITLFEDLTVPANWNNDQMNELKEFSISVEAYAAQERHLENCYKAMYSAFVSAFPGTNA